MDTERWYANLLSISALLECLDLIFKIMEMGKDRYSKVVLTCGVPLSGSESGTDDDAGFGYTREDVR